MRFIHQRITIIKSTRPSSDNINEQLQWFGSSLGLFNLRDKDKSCFRIFIELLKASKKQKALSSDELAAKLGLSRGTVMHHINKLIEAGLVVSIKNRYVLRVDDLSILIDEIEKDAMRALDDLKKISMEIDEELKAK